MTSARPEEENDKLSVDDWGLWMAQHDQQPGTLDGGRLSDQQVPSS